MRRYTVLLTPEPEEGGFSVSVPALPGCFTQGETVDEALANVRDAIAFHLDCLAEEGEAIPEEQAAPQLAAVEV
ncbi:MAG TPA: type II toxin-antitoxin system HicB family antitoxin [Chloroflexota bacterium]|nr:type II toxin-antitoxin system HicB family antitoxin [Chloroflexota bacterium]